jgi:hypothetical protein
MCVSLKHSVEKVYVPINAEAKCVHILLRQVMSPGRFNAHQQSRNGLLVG